MSRSPYTVKIEPFDDISQELEADIVDIDPVVKTVVIWRGNVTTYIPLTSLSKFTVTKND